MSLVYNKKTVVELLIVKCRYKFLRRKYYNISSFEIVNYYHFPGPRSLNV